MKYYLYHNFFQKEDNLEWKKIMITTDKEVLSFYNENREFFDKRNVKREDALKAIRSDIEKRKNEAFLKELTSFQNNMLEDLKIKYRVEKFNN